MCEHRPLTVENFLWKGDFLQAKSHDHPFMLHSHQRRIVKH